MCQLVKHGVMPIPSAGTYIDDNELAPMKGETMTVGQEVIFGEPG